MYATKTYVNVWMLIMRKVIAKLHTNNERNEIMDYYNDYYESDQQTGYTDYTGGFESGNAVVNSVRDFKSLMYQEVIAKSFLFMFAALLITAYAAYSSTSYMLPWLAQGNNLYILFGAEIAIVILSNLTIHMNKPILTAMLFTAYSFLTGATLGIIFLLYTTASVVTIFLVTAGIFGVMAVYGLITKADLSGLGNILLMGLIGIIVISLVNLFIFKSDMADTVISAVGVLIFVGLTAYDTQKIKKSVEYSTSENVLTLALSGAFELYLDFINIFLKLLRLFGKRK